MAIDGGMRNNLAPGTKLTARYKGVVHTAEVVVADGKTLFRLADGREFKSPSAAGSAVMNGQACNGWRFWSVEGEVTNAATKANGATAKPAAARKAKPAGTAAKAAPRATSKPRKATRSVAAEIAPESEPEPWPEGEVR